MKKRFPADIFTSVKTLGAIPVRNDLVRDVLIQAALDPYTKAIDYRANVTEGSLVLPVQAIMIDRADGRFAIDLVDARPDCDPNARALSHLVAQQAYAGVLKLTADDVRAEPRHSAGRLVWRHRNARVDARDHAEILSTLGREGSMTFGRLKELVWSVGDPFATFYAMAWDGSIEIDLHQGLGPHTIVRASNLRPAMQELSYGT